MHAQPADTASCGTPVNTEGRAQVSAVFLAHLKDKEASAACSAGRESSSGATGDLVKRDVHIILG